MTTYENKPEPYSLIVLRRERRPLRGSLMTFSRWIRRRSSRCSTGESVENSVSYITPTFLHHSYIDLLSHVRAEWSHSFVAAEVAHADMDVERGPGIRTRIRGVSRAHGSDRGRTEDMGKCQSMTSFSGSTGSATTSRRPVCRSSA